MRPGGCPASRPTGVRWPPGWAYFDGAADLDGHLLLGKQGESGFLASPTDGGLYMAALSLDAARQHELHDDRGRHFTDGLARCRELAELLAPAERVGPIRVITNWRGYFRHSAGPGWVLVGDAGHFKDFTPGQGIADALRQARTLAETIVAGFGGGEDMTTRLRRWWRWRDADSYEMYWLAHDMGVPGASTPLFTRMLSDIASDASATAQFLGMMNHDLSPAQFFTPRRFATTAVRALCDRPDRAVATLREIASAVNDQAYRTRHRNTAPDLVPQD